jgi:membrane-bound lytic murein transglycosylase A
LRRGVVRSAALALVLASCATPPEPGPGPGPSPGPYPPGPAPRPHGELRLDGLRGWAEADHAGAYAAFVSACGVSAAPGMAAVCRMARAQPGLSARQARAFFEAHFRAEPVAGEGMLTAYFAPEYEARRSPDAMFSAPVRGKPADLVTAGGGVTRRAGGRTEPYPDRAEIEATGAARPLAWMRPEDLFFLQIQGSGVLTFPDGQRMKAGVAATNGRPYVAIGGVLRDRGQLPAEGTTAESIRRWLADRRGPEADAVMRMNPRYIFFSLAPDDGRPPAGAASIPLTAGQTAAVDRTVHAMGDLLWLDADRPSLAGARPHYRRMVMALDVGSAIKGPARVDLYLGQGDQAGAEAGTVRHALTVYRIVPVARR